jgi:hypothetical protein
MSDILVELNSITIFEKRRDGASCCPENPYRGLGLFTPTVRIQWNESDDDAEGAYSLAINAPTRLYLERSDAGLCWCAELRVLGFGFRLWVQATY